MSKQKRGSWTAAEKLRIMLAGLDGSREISELCRREGINPTQYYGWKKQLLGSASKVFENGAGGKPSAKEQRLESDLRSPFRKRQRDRLADVGLWP